MNDIILPRQARDKIGKALTKKTRFLPGGYQEARGSGVSHNHYYIENVLEELDRCALF